MQSTDTHVTRKEIEREARKNDILDAALRLFSQKDYHEVKVDEIAEQVGLSKGTLYLYFENKEKLFYSVVEDRANLLLERIRDAIRSDEPFPTCFHCFISTFFAFFQEHEPFFKIIQTERTLMSGEEHHKMHSLMMKTFQIYYDVLIDLIRRGQKEGVIRNVDPDAAAKTLSGMIDAFIFQRIFIGSKFTIEDETDQLTDLFMNGVKA